MAHNDVSLRNQKRAELLRRRIEELDRRLAGGWGKPKQDNNHTLSGEVRVVLRKMLSDEDE